MTYKCRAAFFGAVLVFLTNVAFGAGNVPSECLRFEGIWSGKWIKGRATAITVKNIRPEGDGCVADVKYAWGALGESKFVREAGSLDVKGSIEGSYLHVPLSKYNASARFTPDSDTVLNGLWKKEGYDDPLSGAFAKQ